jgi:hypothetical protein
MEDQSMGEIIENGSWAGFEVIYTYTRQQAIEDGILIDLTSNFKNETRMFKWPVACTSAVWVLVEEAAEADCVELAVYVWDLSYLALLAIKALRNSGNPELLFSVMLPLRDNIVPTQLKMVCGPAGPTDPSPCLTIMLPEED